MIYENISLKKYNTFGLNVKADRLIPFKHEENVISFLRQQGGSEQSLFVIGQGSNLLFTGDFHGTLIHPEMEGITLEGRKDDVVIISSGAGVLWDKLVESTINNGFGGLENLSLIPGSVGAAPVQNIGAYGVEVRNTIERVRAVSLENGSVREFTNDECQFGYRSSIFKGELKGKYLITKVYFRLSTRPKLSLEYGSLREEVSKLGSVSLKNVREIVINTRKSKLPDPAILGNAGSFFKNPAVSESLAEELKKKDPQLPVFNNDSGEVKIPAGRLIELCGWKGRRIGDAGVHDRQALVLVNFGRATGKEIFDLSEKIKESVFEKFGIMLESEVEIL
ncbi:MAG TPA: UDP-N-acetylmuramate dehydrogenase [Bacteroidales bacterium]|nr:UDP-N-acetylmuramate dehydrogenase [Bacteroidales bacterium]HNR43379.1 UDP-N-acetylmuramate dehydrogenase [Bacteroidales bacterium]HPM18421.1 UDP-N-acetylmuramate dehydrogenase [Bacteroidales bacterium]HQG77351.1 UDP-N-acetylmuramate dehydrogenase [Bacteroidales bacterium]